MAMHEKLWPNHKVCEYTFNFIMMSCILQLTILWHLSKATRLFLVTCVHYNYKWVTNSIIDFQNSSSDIIFKILTCLLLLKSTHLIYLKNIIKRINLITYCLKIHGNMCELNFWSWHYHLIMGLIQSIETMFQTWKSIVLRKYFHLGPTNYFYCECTPKEKMSWDYKVWFL